MALGAHAGRRWWAQPAAAGLGAVAWVNTVAGLLLQFVNRSPPSLLWLQSGRIAEMVADGKTGGAAAAAAGMATAAGDGLREETLLQQKLAE